MCSSFHCYYLFVVYLVCPFQTSSGWGSSKCFVFLRWISNTHTILVCFSFILMIKTTLTDRCCTNLSTNWWLMACRYKYQDKKTKHLTDLDSSSHDLDTSVMSVVTYGVQHFLQGCGSFVVLPFCDHDIHIITPVRRNHHFVISLDTTTKKNKASFLDPLFVSDIFYLKSQTKLEHLSRWE